MKRTYSLEVANDLICLAMYIQTKVYWGSSFLLEEEEDKSYKFSDLWDCIASYVDKGYTSIILDDTHGDTMIRFRSRF